MIVVEKHWVDVHHPEVEFQAVEVTLSSEHGDFTWGVYDETTANAEIARLKRAFAVVAP